MKPLLLLTASMIALTSVTGAFAQNASPTVSKGSARPQMESMQSSDNWRENMMALGTMSLMQSEIATSKASNPKVMEFAKFETSEQNAFGCGSKRIGYPGAGNERQRQGYVA